MTGGKGKDKSGQVWLPTLVGQHKLHLIEKDRKKTKIPKLGRKGWEDGKVERVVMRVVCVCV